MPLSIIANATALLVRRSAQLGISKHDAVKPAELDRSAAHTPLCDRLATLRRAHPLPPLTGQHADQAFFDDLSDGL